MRGHAGWAELTHGDHDLSELMSPSISASRPALIQVGSINELAVLDDLIGGSQPTRRARTALKGPPTLSRGNVADNSSNR